MLASSAIQANQADVLVAGGFESMSNVPFYNTSQRTGKKFGNVTLLDGLAYDGLRDAYNKQPMGNCGELCADSKQITRQQQDDYAVLSYKRSQAASKAGHFKDTIVPVTVKTRRKTIVVTEDEEVWRVKDFDKIRKLRPAFKHPSKAEAKKTVTAANASTLSDGAASVVLISGRAYKKLTNKPKILARVLSYADAAQAPEWFTTAPVLAVNKALQRAKLTTDQIDLYELNEAFSVVALACSKQLNLPIEKVNVLGGSVSIGHPLGASGCRILVTLLNALQIHNKQYGCVGICNGGGGASAIVVERVM
jgi:acetyl-CoA C-acetyltransferase